MRENTRILVQKAQHGDVAAFGKLVGSFQDAVFGVRITRNDQKLRWEVNDQTIGEANLADDELCLTERLILTNHGKGTGAVYRNVVIRSQKLEVDPAWPDADSN